MPTPRIGSRIVPGSRTFAIALAAAWLVVPSARPLRAASVTYTMQTGYNAATFTDGTAGAFNNGGTEMGMYANGGNKEVAVWRNFMTNGTNGGSARSLQVGDKFTITVYASSAYGNIGFSLNDNGTQGSSYANRTSGSRLYIQEDGTTGSWYVNNNAGNTSLDYNVSSTARDYVFQVYMTSNTTANVLLSAGGTDKRAYNLVMNGSAGANIDAFSMWLKDDWNGASSSNIYWKQTTAVENMGFVELGYYLASGATFNPGSVTNGLSADSASTGSTNRAVIGGDAGSMVIFDEANSYSGNTTVNSNAKLELRHANAIDGTSEVVVLSGGALSIYNATGIALASKNATIDGTGVSNANGAIRSTGGNNTWTGNISLSGTSRINSDGSGGAGSLTINGTTAVGANTLYLGGNQNIIFNGNVAGTLTTGSGALYIDNTATTTLAGSNPGLSGLILVNAGTLSAASNSNLGTGTIQLGSGATTATLSITGGDTVRTQGIAIANTSNASVINITSGTTYMNGTLSQAGGTTDTTKFGKSGAGTLYLGSANSYNGQIQIGEGNVILANNTASGTNNSTANRGIDLGLNVGDVSQASNVGLYVLNGVTSNASIYVAPNTTSATRTIGLSGSGSGGFSNEFFLDGNATLTGGSGTATFSGVLKNTGGIIVSGGNVTLTGANTYTGTTTINAGTLRIGTGTTGSIDSTSSIVNNGDLVINKNESLTLKTMTGTGNLTADLSTGFLRLGGNITLGGTVTINNTKSQTGGQAGIRQSQNTTISASAITLNGSLGSAGNDSNYALTLDTSSTNGTITLDIYNGAGGHTWNGASSIVATSGTGALNIVGGQAAKYGLNSPVSLTGALNIASSFSTGVLTLNATAASSITGSLTLSSSAANVWTVSPGVTMTASGNLGGASAAITKNGTGTLILSGSNTYSGATTVNAGTLSVTGNTSSSATTVANGGTLTGTGTVGAVTLNTGGLIGAGTGTATVGKLSGSTLTIGAGTGYAFTIGNVAASVAGTDYDQVALSGALALNNTAASPFTIYLYGTPTGWSGASTYTWDIITAASQTGFTAGNFTTDFTNFGIAAGLRGGNWTFSNPTAGNIRLTYTGVASESYWSGGAGNWDAGFSPALSDGNSITYNGTAGGTSTNNIASATLLSVGNITFTAGAGAYTLAANSGSAGFNATTALSLAGNIVNNSSNTQTVNTALTLATTRTVDAASANIAVGGVISGAGGLTKNGTNTLTLSGNNTYAGATTINAGTLQVGGSGQLGGGAYSGNISNSGTLLYASSASQVLSGVVSGTGALAVNGSGTLTLNGTNTYNGTTTLSAGQLNINSAAAIGTGTLTITGGTIDNTSAAAITLSNNNPQNWNGDFAFTGTKDLNMGTGAVAMNATRTVAVNGGNFTVGGIISGAGFGLTKNGSGTMVLTGNNTYSGATTINTGTLLIGGAGLLGGGNYTGNIVNSGSLVLGSSGTQILGGILSGNGALTKNGSGTLTLSGNNTYSGGTTISGGSVYVGNNSAFGTGNVTLDNISIGSSAEATISNNITLTNTVTVGIGYNTSNLTFSGILSGSGTLNFDTNNTGAIITLTGLNTFTSNISAPRTAGGIHFNSIANAGVASALGAGSSISTGAGSYTPTLRYTGNSAASTNRTISMGGGGLIIRSDAAALTWTGNITGNSLPLYLNGIAGGGANYNELSGAFLGGSSLIISAGSGNDVWRISGNNTHTGLTQITNTSTMIAANANAFGTTAGATQVDTSGQLLLTGGISVGTEALTLNSNASGTWNGYTGAALRSISGNNSWAGNITLSQATTIATDSGAALTLSGNITGANNLTINSTGSTTVSGVVATSTGSLTKSGTGTLTLSGNNTYTGATTVNAGTLSVGSMANGGAASNIGQSTNAAGNLVLGGGELAYTGGTASTDRNFTLTAGTTSTINVTQSGTSLTIGGGAASTNGSLVKAGAGTLTLSGNNSYSGTTTINAGTLEVAAGGRLGGGNYTGAITNNAALLYSGTNNQTLSGVVSGTGALTKNGTATLTLSASNTHTGATTVNNGELFVSNTGSLGGNGTITIGAAGTLSVDSPSRTMSNNMTLNGGTLRGGFQSTLGTGGTVTVSGTLATHVFTTNGTLVLPVAVSASELLVGGGGGAQGFPGWYNSGGGGGQVLNLTSQSLLAGNTTVTVGAGGAYGSNGSATSIGSNTASGGYRATVAGRGGTSGSGNAGGNGTGVANGGGGGDSAVGGVGTNPTVGGAGGAGSANTAIVGLTGYGQLSGGNYYFGGGGGGQAQTNNAVGGLGGGGQSGSNGTANTGGGAGGGATQSGGSGLAVVQYVFDPYAAGSLTLAGTLDVQSASTLDAYSNGSLVNITGLMQTTAGSGGITIASSLSSGGIVRYSNSMAYAGDTTVNSGAILQMNATNAMANGAGKGNLVLSGTLDLRGQTGTTINGLSGNGVVDNTSGAGSYTLSVGGNNAGGTFAGTIRNTSGSTALTKIGSGTLTLTGNNTYSGATTVSSGTLVVNGSAANSAVTIGNTGVLGGNGTVGALTVQSGGRVAPGNSPGNLNASTLTLEGGGGYNWEITNVTGTPGTNWDLITVGGGTGAATVSATSGNKFTVYLIGNPTGWNTNTSYDWNIIDWGTVTGFDANAFAVDTTGFTGTAPVGTWSFSNTGGFLNLAYTASTNSVWNGASGNWSTGFSPALTTGNKSITFDGAAGGTATNDIASATVGSVASITFNSTAGAYTLAANSGSAGYDTASAMQLNGNIVNNSTASQTINLALTSTATRTYDAAAGNLTIGGAVSGTGGLTKNGSNLLALSANNTYSGDTTINAGTLQITSTGLLGGGSYSGNIANSGTLLAGSNGNQTLSGILSGSGALAKNGTGTLALTGNNTYTGGTTLNAGTLSIGHAKGLGTGNLTQTSGGSLLVIDTTGTISNNMSVYNVRASQSATLGGAITVNNAVWDVDGGDTLTISGGVGGSGGVTKNGTGTLILSGSNTYSGATTINAGTLNAAASGALGATPSVTVNNGGSLLVSANGSIGDATPVTLAGGTLAFSGNVGEVVGALTLTSNSVVDMGSGAAWISFDSLTSMLTSTTQLQIWNYTPGSDAVYFRNSANVQSSLGFISFYSGAGTGTFFNALNTASFSPPELYPTPVPEPETYATALLLLLGMGLYARREARRRRQTAR